MENTNKNQDQNRQGQNVRPGQNSPETKDFSKNREGQYSNDSSRQSGQSGQSGEINRGQGQNNQRRDDESLRH